MLRRLAAHLAPAGAAADGAGDDAEVAVGAVPGVAHYTDPASGARTLIRTLVANDVTVCFSNPGTSEMHFVAGLDSEPEMRPVLVLQEVRLPCPIRIRCRSTAAPPEPLAPAQQQRGKQLAARAVTGACPVAERRDRRRGRVRAHDRGARLDAAVSSTSLQGRSPQDLTLGCAAGTWRRAWATATRTCTTPARTAPR